jgi:hypothetical protein
MKKSSGIFYIAFVLSLLLFPMSMTHCKKTGEKIIYTEGVFPDSIINLSNINTQYDDYNITIPQFLGNSPIIFSSNRGSAGGQFDLVQGNISFAFNQMNGNLILTSEITSDQFLTKLISKANTVGNDFGPYRLFGTTDGYEYLLLSSQNAGNLDLYFLKNRPMFGSVLPDVSAPSPIKILNTGFNDAYICFDSNVDTAYFSSDRSGNYDIYLNQRPLATSLDKWFSQDYSASTKVDSINSTNDDICPFIYSDIMVFASNRSGGMGGYDLYYSLFRKGKWSSPLNFGPVINSVSDETSPVLVFNPDFTNLLMIFSSNRPGGKGGFDFYFTGVEFP